MEGGELRFRDSEERPDIQGKLHPSNRENKSHHRLPSRWGTEIEKSSATRGCLGTEEIAKRKNIQREEKMKDWAWCKAWEKLGKRVAPPPRSAGGGWDRPKTFRTQR